MISSQAIKDWVQIGTLATFIFGLFKATYEIRESRNQRMQELRWKKANSAKEVLDDIHNHELAKNAVHMLDWCGGQAEYETAPGRREVISYSDVLNALAKNGAEPKEPKEVYIRDCFDWFFYRVERIEHYITRGLIDFQDVKGVFKNYAKEVSKNWKTYDAFLAFHEYDLAREFLHRYTESGGSSV